MKNQFTPLGASWDEAGWDRFWKGLETLRAIALELPEKADRDEANRRIDAVIRAAVYGR